VIRFVNHSSKIIRTLRDGANKTLIKPTSFWGGTGNISYVIHDSSRQLSRFIQPQLQSSSQALLLLDTPLALPNNLYVPHPTDRVRQQFLIPIAILGILAQVLLFYVYFTSKHSALLFATHDVHFSLLI